MMSSSDNELHEPVNTSERMDSTAEIFGKLRQVLRQFNDCPETWDQKKDALLSAKISRDHTVPSEAQSLAKQAAYLNSQLPPTRQHPAITLRVLNILTSVWEPAPLQPGEREEDRGIGYQEDWDLRGDIITKSLECDEWMSLCKYHQQRRELFSKMAETYGDKVQHSKNWSCAGSRAIAHTDVLQLYKAEAASMKQLFTKAKSIVDDTERACITRAVSCLEEINKLGTVLGLDWEITLENAIYMAEEYRERYDKARPASRPYTTAEQRTARSVKPPKPCPITKRRVRNNQEPSWLVDAAVALQ